MVVHGAKDEEVGAEHGNVAVDEASPPGWNVGAQIRVYLKVSLF